MRSVCTCVPKREEEPAAQPRASQPYAVAIPQTSKDPGQAVGWLAPPWTGPGVWRLLRGTTLCGAPEDHLKDDKEGPSPSNEPGKPCWCLFRKFLCLKKKAQHRVSEKLFRKIGQIIHQNLHLTRREAPEKKNFGFRGPRTPPPTV